MNLTKEEHHVSHMGGACFECVIDVNRWASQ